MALLPVALSTPGVASLILKPTEVAVASGVKSSWLAATPDVNVLVANENVVLPMEHEVPTKLRSVPLAQEVAKDGAESATSRIVANPMYF